MAEQPPGSISEHRPTPEEILESFRDEIRALMDEENQKGKTAHFTHMDFNPDNLTEADKEIWDKIKDETITLEDIQAYKHSMQSVDNPSRLAFQAFINNRATPIIGNRELKALMQGEKSQ